MALHLALEIDGAGSHPGAALATSIPTDRLLSADHLRRTVAAAENAGVTLVTLDDSLVGPARIDAVTRAAFVAPLTSRIGLVPLAHPAVTEPFHLASQVAALDHAATGRSGWLVGSGPVTGARAALDRPVAEGQDLLDETRDVVRVVRDLWDSWEDDAVIRDTATGRYIDRDRLHHVDFTSGGTGPFAGPGLRDAPDGGRAPFTVKGPLIVPRGPQGQPVVVARAGTVPVDLVDIVLVHSPETSGAPLTFLDLHVTLDTDRATAVDRLAALDDLVPSTDVLRWTGSPDGLVELLLSLRGAVDGVRLLPTLLEEDLPQIVRWVLPALRVARATPTPRPGATLRETLGLPRPTNRHATLQETS